MFNKTLMSSVTYYSFNDNILNNKSVECSEFNLIYISKYISKMILFRS